MIRTHKHTSSYLYCPSTKTQTQQHWSYACRDMDTLSIHSRRCSSESTAERHLNKYTSTPAVCWRLVSVQLVMTSPTPYYWVNADTNPSDLRITTQPYSRKTFTQAWIGIRLLYFSLQRDKKSGKRWRQWR